MLLSMRAQKKRRDSVNMNQNPKCPIWGYPARSVTFRDHLFLVENSLRAGGNYQITWDAKDIVDFHEVTDDQKARLTTLLDDHRRQGNKWPVVTTTLIEKAKNARMIPVQERADRLLRYIAESSSNKIGEWVPILNVNNPIHLGGLVKSDSIDFGELDYLCRYLSESTWIEHYRAEDGNPYPNARVTVTGYNRIESQVAKVDSSQAFVAMWFDEGMNAVYELGIKPAIEATGYKAQRIDQKEHINKIDDEIIAELRRSRFVVADFTHGHDGTRGGVYYEAGFAHGLDLDVIFACRKDAVETLHFDTEHYNHIVWSTPEELREQLKTRILATIGEGPELRSNP